MSTSLNLESTLRDASDEEIRTFILETLLELLHMAALLQRKGAPKKKKRNMKGLH